MTRQEIFENFQESIKPYEKSHSIIDDNIVKYAEEHMEFKNPERSLSILRMRSEGKTLTFISTVVGVTVSSARDTCVLAQRKYCAYLRQKYMKDLQNADNTRITNITNKLRSLSSRSEADIMKVLINIIMDINLDGVEKSKRRQYLIDYFNTPVTKE